MTRDERNAYQRARHARLHADDPGFKDRMADRARLASGSKRKRCTKCGRLKDRTSFSKRSASKSGLQAWCKPCDAVRQAAWKARHPGRGAAYKRDWKRRNRHRVFAYWLKSRYGLTTEQWRTLLRSQGGRCAICRIKLRTGTKACHLDHDHRTHRIRGVLCFRCNTGLGLLGDEPRLLYRAIEYLRPQTQRHSLRIPSRGRSGSSKIRPGPSSRP